jgi:hypothetical protein
MSDRHFARFTLAGALTAGVIPLVAACGGGGATPPPDQSLTSGGTSSQEIARGPRMDASRCGKSVVYVSNPNEVYIYDQEHNRKSPCGRILPLSNPVGLFVDVKRNIWVAMPGVCPSVAATVLEFARGKSTPIKTLQDPDGWALDVAVDNASGTVYVINGNDRVSGCREGNGAVEVYANGSTTPTGTLTDPHMNYAFNDAVDDMGNLYVTYFDGTLSNGIGRIDEWLGGQGTPIDLGITLKSPTGIQTTASGALLVCDEFVACGQFAPGSTTMTNLFATKRPWLFAVALDSRESHAWVDNARGFAQLQRYHYPGPDDRAQETIRVPGGPTDGGVAVSPPSPQGKPY